MGCEKERVAPWKSWLMRVYIRPGKWPCFYSPFIIIIITITLTLAIRTSTNIHPITSTITPITTKQTKATMSAPEEPRPLPSLPLTLTTVISNPHAPSTTAAAITTDPAPNDVPPDLPLTGCWTRGPTGTSKTSPRRRAGSAGPTPLATSLAACSGCSPLRSWWAAPGPRT